MAATTKAARGAAKPSLATIATAITKNILGAELAKPKTVKLPRAVAEIHVSPDDVIPAGTVITDEIAELAGLDSDGIDALEAGGYVDFVEVYAQLGDVEDADPTPAA
ncbi:hypothetical protein [Sphingomonas sp. GM_Shp_1]|uniref:hypothetical protein n=1 Tax=Sphingomonas sp. GM_Shp_1 TaxID=2937381 RepID=UPI00226B7A05|nr:hypothetical protein [Sphingomonas sp. GM_Shp_1]